MSLPGRAVDLEDELVILVAMYRYVSAQEHGRALHDAFRNFA